MKKLVSALLSLSLLAGAVSVPVWAAGTPANGDVNTDGTLKIGDAILLSRYVAEDVTVIITEEGIANADANGDGDITSADVTTLLMQLANLDMEEALDKPLSTDDNDAESTQVPGDVNMDGVLDFEDAAMIGFDSIVFYILDFDYDTPGVYVNREGVTIHRLTEEQIAIADLGSYAVGEVYDQTREEYNIQPATKTNIGDAISILSYLVYTEKVDSTMTAEVYFADPLAYELDMTNEEIYAAVDAYEHALVDEINERFGSQLLDYDATLD